MAVLDILRVYRIERTFRQSKVVNAIQECSFSCSIGAYNQVQLVCKSQLNGGVVFEVRAPEFSKQHQLFWRFLAGSVSLYRLYSEIDCMEPVTNFATVSQVI